MDAEASSQVTPEVFSLIWALLRQIISSPAGIYLILVSNSLAFMIERTPKVPSWIIPWICVPLGTVFYYLVAPRNSVPYDFANPLVVLWASGFIASVLSIFVLHGQVVKRVFFTTPAKSDNNPTPKDP